MRKWKLITGVGLVFILGILTGAVGTKMYLKYEHPLFKRDSEARKAFIMRRLNRELDLTLDQKMHIEKILNQLDEAVKKYRSERRQEIKRLFDDGYSKMKEVLSPEQQNKLDEMRGEFKRRKKRR